jgi:hypothetical protein
MINICPSNLLVTNVEALTFSVFDNTYREYLRKNNMLPSSDGATNMVISARSMIGKNGKEVGAGGAWCAVFVWNCAKTVKQDSAFTYCTNTRIGRYVVSKNNGKYIYSRENNSGNIYNAIPGDIVVYDNGAHVEIVSKTPSGGSITSIGGNTGNNDNLKATVKEHSWGTSHVYYIVRPVYKTNTLDAKDYCNHQKNSINEYGDCTICGKYHEHRYDAYGVCKKANCKQEGHHYYEICDFDKSYKNYLS